MRSVLGHTVSGTSLADVVSSSFLIRGISIVLRVDIFPLIVAIFNDRAVMLVAGHPRVQLGPELALGLEVASHSCFLHLSLFRRVAANGDWLERFIPEILRDGKIGVSVRLAPNILAFVSRDTKTDAV